MNVADSERENATAPSPSDTPPELAVVIPTLNERENVAALVDRLGAALAGLRWKAIFGLRFDAEPGQVAPLPTVIVPWRTWERILSPTTRRRT